MINLKIDSEFQSQIPPLTDDEFHQLEENILKEGKLISPLIVWGNTLVDGHNRYEIGPSDTTADFARRIWKCTARYCSMNWCYPTSSLNIVPRLTKRHETAWS